MLSYHIALPWRWGYLAVLIGIFMVPLIIHVNFTAIGHFSAIFIGLCFYPMARVGGRPNFLELRATVPASRDT
jgi:hypothetical protein